MDQVNPYGTVRGCVDWDGVVGRMQGADGTIDDTSVLRTLQYALDVVLI